MSRRRKKRTLKPRLPARIRKKGGRKGKPKSAQHLELTGLGLLALGMFLASILYLGWRGGMVGGGIADVFTGAIGTAAYVAPVAFVIVGALMVARSALVDVRPFRTGLLVTTFGLLATLGSAHGGAIGRGLDRLFGMLVGSTGTTIIGVLALGVGALLGLGASAGARVRRPHRGGARADARPFRHRRHDCRPDLGAARHALRAAAGAGNEGVEGRGAQGRLVLCARDDRDPDPGADPGEAGGRRRDPQSLP